MVKELQAGKMEEALYVNSPRSLPGTRGAIFSMTDLAAEISFSLLVSPLGISKW
jgi:hypothetical protein